MNSGFPAYRERPFPPRDNTGNAPNMSGQNMGGQNMGGQSMGGQNMGEQNMSAMDLGMGFAMPGGHSLVDYNQNDGKTDRRKSMPVYGALPMHVESFDSRRMSMMDFTDGSGVDLDAFQFNPQPGPPMGMMQTGSSFPQTTSELRNGGLSTADLGLSTQFANQNTSYTGMQPPGPAYTSSLHPNVSLDMDMASAYPNALSMPLDPNDSSLAMMGSDMNMFSGPQFAAPMMGSPITQDFMGPIPAHELQPLELYGNTSLAPPRDAHSGSSSRADSQEQSSTPSQSRPPSEQLTNPNSLPNQMAGASLPAQEPNVSQHEVPTDSFARMGFPWTTPPEGFPSTMNGNQHVNTQFKNAYSASGFDMLGVLTRVASRPNPQIDIGSVDLSCAFVVCDAQQDEHPIVYCSENFERLTGYSKHMILNRNCRFLQAPDGNVQAKATRRYTDDNAVRYLKEMLDRGQEAQISLINYRRGGQPFMNLLTMIPIAWEAGGKLKFFVGFQVDLVEQPGSMTYKNPDGSFRVNYQRGLSMPTYNFKSDGHKLQSEIGQTISKDEVSSLLSSYGSGGDSEIASHIWDKILLENTDDVIHVLSLKGLFLYLSPSSNKVLEYDPSELVGTGLSSVCHPSDIVPVTRELKETTTGASVNVVFRIRRKKSGYMWFEGHGSLHTEQGKGRKFIILVGRKRPVYTLSRMIVRESGGIGDNELWSKMSTSGMFLFVSGNVRQLLDRQPEELVGTSIQAAMRPDSKHNFNRVLELARTGRKVEAKHEMINRRGQVLQACTTIYPGDAVEGQKPTFVVAQTRLLKYTKNAHGQRPSMYTKEHTLGESKRPVPSAQPGASPMYADPTNTAASMPATMESDSHFPSRKAGAVTLGDSTGFPIGHQDHSLASDDNTFDELKTTRSSSWQYELRQMEKRNRYLAEEVQSLLAARKKRKRRKGAGQLQKDCANCHTRTTPEWRRGPSGNRDLCNSCGLRWAKQMGRVSPRNSSQNSVSDKGKKSMSPRHTQQPILPLPLPNALHDGQPSTFAPGEKRSQTQANAENHAAKIARLESVAPQGYGGGIPARIDEGTEPE